VERTIISAFVFVCFCVYTACYLLSVLHKERKATFLHQDTLDLFLLDFAWRPGVMSERERGRPVYFAPSGSELEGKGGIMWSILFGAKQLNNV
jgi:hypothetical protein